MKIVVDTNIIFSALLNSNGTIGDLLFNSDKDFEFYSCSYMRYETQKELEVSYTLVISKLKFINEEIIPVETWLAAEQITKSFDIDDTDFVALTKFLKAHLWTGDKILYKGLKKSNFKKVYNTAELLSIRAAR